MITRWIIKKTTPTTIVPGSITCGICYQSSAEIFLESHDRKIFEFGFYAVDIKLTFKTQEIYGESIVPSIRKVSFKPLLEIHFQEVYSVTIICGIRKFNVTCGASFVEVVGLDDCPCGIKSRKLLFYPVESS